MVGLMENVQLTLWESFFFFFCPFWHASQSTRVTPPLTHVSWQHPLTFEAVELDCGSIVSPWQRRFLQNSTFDARLRESASQLQLHSWSQPVKPYLGAKLFQRIRLTLAPEEARLVDY